MADGRCRSPEPGGSTWSTAAVGNRRTNLRGRRLFSRSGRTAWGALVGVDIGVGCSIDQMCSTGVVVVGRRQRRRRPGAGGGRMQSDVRTGATAVGRRCAGTGQDQGEDEDEEARGEEDRQEDRTSEIAFIAVSVHGGRFDRVGAGTALSHAASVAVPAPIAPRLTPPTDPPAGSPAARPAAAEAHAPEPRGAVPAPRR
jgi:hypothetical protein